MERNNREREWRERDMFTSLCRCVYLYQRKALRKTAGFENGEWEWRESEIRERDICASHGRCVNFSQKKLIYGVYGKFSQKIGWTFSL